MVFPLQQFASVVSWEENNIKKILRISEVRTICFLTISFREVWTCSFSAEGLGKRIMFEECSGGLVSPSLPFHRQHCLIRSTPRSLLGDHGSLFPLHFSKKGACQWKSGVGFSKETSSGFIYSCKKLVQSFVYFKGRVVSYLEVESSGLGGLSVQVLVCCIERRQGEAFLTRDRCLCFSPST